MFKQGRHFFDHHFVYQYIQTCLIHLKLLCNIPDMELSSFLHNCVLHERAPCLRVRELPALQSTCSDAVLQPHGPPNRLPAQSAKTTQG